MSLYNYHTHTSRCRHAVGTDEDYVIAAIESGFKVLGFSDHSPMIFDDGHESGFRMLLKDTDDYVKSIRHLQEKYKDKIDIKLGFELEYLPKLFDRIIDYLDQFDYDYLILGQHFTDNEYEASAHYCGSATIQKKHLDKYIAQALDGLKTGKFAYIAHPDLIKYKGPDSIYKDRMTYFCREIKKLGYPIEFNKYGYTDRRNYPDRRFWEIAAEVGNDVIIGFDAHYPDSLRELDVYNEMKQYLNSLGIHPIESIVI